MADMEFEHALEDFMASYEAGLEAAEYTARLTKQGELCRGYRGVGANPSPREPMLLEELEAEERGDL